jgi:hypothetical protein
MKAIVFHRYGSPDVLELKEIDTPVVEDDQMLVKVQAASVNPLDWHNMSGVPYLMRATVGLAKPKNTGLGAEQACPRLQRDSRHVRRRGRPFLVSNSGSSAHGAPDVEVRAPEAGLVPGETKQG